MAITITLSSELLLSDDGGDYNDQTPSDQRAAEVLARVRIDHYSKAGHTVNFDNQATDGVQTPETGTRYTANAK
jgi:hypothetical protein